MITIIRGARVVSDGDCPVGSTQWEGCYCISVIVLFLGKPVPNNGLFESEITLYSGTLFESGWLLLTHSTMILKKQVNLPYIDYLLESFGQDSESLETSFGRHIHWGYWPQPNWETPNVLEFAAAAERLTIQVLAAAEIRNGQKILDAGCGFGGTLAHLNENYRRMDLLGLNLDDRQLHRAKERVLAIDDNRIRFYQGNACSLPFQDEAFDTLLAVECIFHFPDRGQFLREAKRVLKPGGSLAFSDFVPVKSLLPLTKTSTSRVFKTGFYGECNVQCTVERYRQLAESNGFSVTLEKDITANTLPTYRYLRGSDSKIGVHSVSAVIGTLSLEILSRLIWLKYIVYGFKKAG